MLSESISTNQSKLDLDLGLILSPKLLFGGFPITRHFLQLVIQSHDASRIIKDIVLPLQQWLDEAVEVRVFLEWGVGCLYLRKVGFVN